MSFVKLNGGLSTKPDRRVLGPATLRRANNVEMRVGQEGLFAAGSYVLIGSVTPQDGPGTTAGLVYAQFDATGGFLICDYGRKAAEANVGTSGVQGDYVTLDDRDLEFEEPPTVFSSLMLNDRLHVIMGVNLSMGDGPEARNLIRQPDGNWRREGLSRPEGDNSAVTDVTIVEVPAVTPYTYRPKYMSNLSDAAKVSGGKNVNDTDPTTAAVVTVTTAGNTKRAMFSFVNLAASGQATGSQPSTGVGVLSLLAAAGPRAAWADLGVGGAGNYSIDADIILEYSTTGTSGTWIPISSKKAPFISEWFTVDLSASSITITDLAVRVSVTKNSGSKDGTAFVGEIRFDVGGGDKDAVNTSADTVDEHGNLNGLHYLITLFSDPGLETKFGFPGSGRDGAPGDYGKAISFPVATYPNGIKQLSFPLPMGSEQDAGATTYKIWRNDDGSGAKILDHYGLIDQVPIDRSQSQAYTDNFNTFPITEVPQPTLPSYFTGQGTGIVFFPLNEIPPIAVSQCVYKGSRILVRENDSNVYFTHPYDWESVPGLYNIPSRSPRNDQPECVASMQEAWFIFYGDYTRRVQGLPLILDGQFNATAYAETNESRGACGPGAVCTITRDGDDGNAVLFCVDRLGFYVRNETQIQPWSKDVIWTDVANPSNGLALPDAASLRKLRVIHNAKFERVEIFYLYDDALPNSFNRLDVYYNRMQDNGQPTVLGPILAKQGSRVAVGRDQDEIVRSFAADTLGQRLWLMNQGHLNVDGNEITRTIQTGYFPILGEPGRDGYVKYFEIYMGTPEGSSGDLAATIILSRNGYEDRTADVNFRPTAPSRIGIWSKAEFVSVYVTDSTGGSTGLDLAEIMGYDVEIYGRGDGKNSAQRGTLGRDFNSSKPLTGF